MRSVPFCSEMLKIVDLNCYHHFFWFDVGGLDDGNGGNEKIAKNRKRCNKMYCLDNPSREHNQHTF